MERPTRLTASRIIGLDLSKKTLVGCTLTEKDGFQRKRFFSGKMNAAGRSKFASTLGSTDAVFMEGGSSSFIPGIGEVTASHFLSEIPDISRFATCQKLIAFAGTDLASTNRETPASS